MTLYASDRIFSTEQGVGNLIAGLSTPLLKETTPTREKPTGLNVQSYIVHGLTLTIVSGMNATVNSGRAIVANDNGKRGASFVINDDSVSLQFKNGDISNDRIDSVILRVDMTAEDDQQTCFIEIIEGIPSAQPEPPTELPPNSMILYNVTIPKGSTSLDDKNVEQGSPNGSAGGVKFHNFSEDNHKSFPAWWWNTYGFALEKPIVYEDIVLRKIDIQLALYYGRSVDALAPDFNFTGDFNINDGTTVIFPDFFPKEIRGELYQPDITSELPPGAGNTLPSQVVYSGGYDSFRPFWGEANPATGKVKLVALQPGKFTGAQQNILQFNFTYYLKAESY